MKIHFSLAWLRSAGAVIFTLVMALVLFIFLNKDAVLNPHADTTGQSTLPAETTVSVETTVPAESSEPAATENSTQEPSVEQTTSSGSAGETTDETTTVPQETEKVLAAMWVDGKRVPMTSAQLTEFETKLYQCKTEAEYIAMMDTLAMYNKPVDLSRFSWYWDDLQDLYSDEQIAMMKTGISVQKKVPNLVGLEVKEAYQVMINCGMIARFSYYYSAGSNLPVGYCYYQDISAGSMMNCLACVIVHVQAPPEISRTSVHWDPDDWDFDIYAVAEEISGINETTEATTTIATTATIETTAAAVPTEAPTETIAS